MTFKTSSAEHNTFCRQAEHQVNSNQKPSLQVTLKKEKEFQGKISAFLLY